MGELRSHVSALALVLSIPTLLRAPHSGAPTCRAQARFPSCQLPISAAAPQTGKETRPAPPPPPAPDEPDLSLEPRRPSRPRAELQLLGRSALSPCAGAGLCACARALLPVSQPLGAPRPPEPPPLPASAWDRPHYSPPPLPAQARKDHAREKRRTRPVCATRLGSLVCGRVCVCVCLVVCPLGTLPRLRRPPGRGSCLLLRPQTPRTQFPISDVSPDPLPPVSPSSSHHPRPARLRPTCRLGLRLLPRLLPKCAVQFALWRGLPRRQCCPRLLDLPGLSAAAKGTPAQSSADGASHAPSDLPTVSSPLLPPVFLVTGRRLPELELVSFCSRSGPDWPSPEF